MGTLNRSVQKILAIGALFGALGKTKMDTPMHKTNASGRVYGGGRKSAAASDGAIYTPKRTKLKGYQKENLKYTS